MAGRPEGLQTQVTSIKQGIASRLYQTKEFFDCTFAFRGEQGIEDKKIKAHTFVLAACSKHFQKMLLGCYVPDPIIIDNEYITRDGFEILLRFIYTRKVGTEENKLILEAFLAANYYEQEALKDLCERKIATWQITKDDVWHMLKAGFIISEQDNKRSSLKDRCMEYIKNNVHKALSSPTFLNINYECLNAVLDSGILNQVPVMQRLDRIMDWASARHTKPVNYSLVRETFENSIPPLLGKLEMKTLSIDEMSRIAFKYRDFITSEEFMGFSFYCNGDSSKIPPWCVPPPKDESFSIEY